MTSKAEQKALIRQAIQTTAYTSAKKAEDEAFREFLASQGFTHVKQLEGGEYVGLLKLVTTMSVCCDITWDRTFSYRWCFKDPAEASFFLLNITEYDEVPSLRNSLVGHRYIDKPRLMLHDERGFPRW